VVVVAKAAVIMSAMSQKIAEWIKDCDYVSDVAENVDIFLNTALRKSDTYARILILSNLLNEQNIVDLREYCKSRSAETVVIIFGKRGRDDEAVRRYLQLYASASACAMMMDGKFSKELAMTSVLMPAPQINQRYGIKDVFNVEVAHSSYAVPEAKPTQPEQSTQQQQEGEPEKRSLLKSLFGSKKGKKDKKSQNVAEQAPVQDAVQNNPYQNIAGQAQQLGFNGQSVGTGQASQPQSANFGGQPQQMGFDNQPQQMGFDNQPQPMSSDNQSQQMNYGSQSQPTGFDSTQSMASNPSQQGYISQSQPAEFASSRSDIEPLEMGFDNIPSMAQEDSEDDFCDVTAGVEDTGFPVGAGTPQETQSGVGYNQGFTEPQSQFGQSVQQSFATGQMSSTGNQQFQAQGGEQYPNMASQPQRAYEEHSMQNTGSQNMPYIGQPQNQGVPYVGQPQNQGMSYGSQVQQPQMQSFGNQGMPYGGQAQSFANQNTPYGGQTQAFGNQGASYGGQMQGVGAQSNGYAPSEQQVDSMYAQNANVDSSSWGIPNPAMGAQSGYSQDFNAGAQAEVTMDMDFSMPTIPQSLPQTEVQDTQIVDDDPIQTLEGIGLEDNKVRERESGAGRPKVVTTTIIRNVTGSKDLIKGMAECTSQKVLIVTGDRGTGVTSTAFTLARQLSKQVDVLYFDCDIENHGLLNYIDYNKFCGFEDTNRNGISLCRSARAFDSCIMMWDDGLTFLTSDFSCDVPLDMLTLSGGIVAEKCLDYGLTVVDCPIKYLPCINELLLVGNTALCVEGSKRGFMNMLCQLEASPLEAKYKRRMCASGTMLLTKCNAGTDLKKLVNYITSIYEPDGANWMAVNKVAFNGKWTDKMISAVLS